MHYIQRFIKQFIPLLDRIIEYDINYSRNITNSPTSVPELSVSEASVPELSVPEASVSEASVSEAELIEKEIFEVFLLFAKSLLKMEYITFSQKYIRILNKVVSLTLISEDHSSEHIDTSEDNNNGNKIKLIYFKEFWQQVCKKTILSVKYFESTLIDDNLYALNTFNHKDLFVVDLNNSNKLMQFYKSTIVLIDVFYTIELKFDNISIDNVLGYINTYEGLTDHTKSVKHYLYFYFWKYNYSKKDINERQTGSILENIKEDLVPNNKIPSIFQNYQISQFLFNDNCDNSFLQDYSKKHHNLKKLKSIKELVVFVAYIRHHKDDIKIMQVYESIETITQKIFAKYNTNQYNIKAAKIINLYIYNNCLSFKIKQDTDFHRIDEIDSIFDKIETYQQTNNIYNPFALYKYINYKLNYAKILLKNDIDSLINTNIISNILNNLDEYKKMNSYWFHPTTVRYEFLLPYEETIVKINDTDVSIISLLRNRKDNIDFKKQIDIFESEIKIIELIAVSYNTTKVQFAHSLENETIKTTEKLEFKVKENDKRSIEIITLFSAIVMFVAGDIQIIKNTQIHDAITLMMLFGFTLSLFAGLIMIILNIYNGKKSKIIFTVSYFIYLILGLIAIMILLK